MSADYENEEGTLRTYAVDVTIEVEAMGDADAIEAIRKALATTDFDAPFRAHDCTFVEFQISEAEEIWKGGMPD